MRGALLTLGAASCLPPVFTDNATFPEIRQLDLAYFSNAQAWRDRGVFGLHVGCGLSLPAEALNTDIEGIAVPGKGRSTLDDPLVAIDVADDDRRYFLQHNALQPFPLASGSFDWIYSEHFIEHVSRDGAVTFFRQARKMLPEYGGLIRISTPDLALYVNGYLDPHRRFLREHHKAMTTGPMDGKNTHLRPTGAAVFNDLFRGYGHAKGYIYDFDELLSVADEAEILVPTGDCTAEPTGYRVSSRIPHVANLDDAVKAHETLYVDFVCGSVVDRW